MSKPDTQKGRAWIATMDDSVSKQRKLLGLFLDHIAEDERCRWLQLSGSLARKAGDQWSDIDTTLGIEDKEWPDTDRVKNLVSELGPVSDMLEHGFSRETSQESRHLITVYEDGLQLSVVVMPSSWLPGLRPSAVTLYDLDQHLARPESEYPSFKNATSSQVRQWAFFAWLSLLDMAKFLDRRSLWEAHEQLETARNNVWRLWAVANQVDYAIYGIAHIIDDEIELPKEIEQTVTALELEPMRAAALKLADILIDVSERLSETHDIGLFIRMSELAKKSLSE
jgi:hypothetical protein